MLEKYDFVIMVTFLLPGGNIAASWVTLKSIGEDGYFKIATKLMDTTRRLKEGINNIPVRLSTL